MTEAIKKSPPVKLVAHGNKIIHGVMTKLAGLEPHPLALIFPPYTKDELDNLACDVRDHGLIEPITIYAIDGREVPDGWTASDGWKRLDGWRVIDGWNRVEACKRAGWIEVPFEVFRGDETQAQAFVYAKNMLRRQLTDDQRAGIAARFATMTSGARTDLPPNGGRLPGLSVAAAASQAGISKRTVERRKQWTSKPRH